jgi:hypothetical protein
MNAKILGLFGLALVASSSCSGDLRRSSPCFAWAESVCKSAERCSVYTSVSSDLDDCISNLSQQCNDDYDEERLSSVEDCIDGLEGVECPSAVSTLVGISCQSVVTYGYRVYNADGTEVPLATQPVTPPPFFSP